MLQSTLRTGDGVHAKSYQRIVEAMASEQGVDGLLRAAGIVPSDHEFERTRTWLMARSTPFTGDQNLSDSSAPFRENADAQRIQQALAGPAARYKAEQLEAAARKKQKTSPKGKAVCAGSSLTTAIAAAGRVLSLVGKQADEGSSSGTNPSDPLIVDGYPAASLLSGCTVGQLPFHKPGELPPVTHGSFGRPLRVGRRSRDAEIPWCDEWGLFECNEITSRRSVREVIEDDGLQYFEEEQLSDEMSLAYCRFVVEKGGWVLGNWSRIREKAVGPIRDRRAVIHGSRFPVITCARPYVVALVERRGKVFCCTLSAQQVAVVLGFDLRSPVMRGLEAVSLRQGCQILAQCTAPREAQWPLQQALDLLGEGVVRFAEFGAGGGGTAATLLQLIPDRMIYVAAWEKCANCIACHRAAWADRVGEVHPDGAKAHQLSYLTELLKDLDLLHISLRCGPWSTDRRDTVAACPEKRMDELERAVEEAAAMLKAAQLVMPRVITIEEVAGVLQADIIDAWRRVEGLILGVKPYRWTMRLVKGADWYTRERLWLIGERED
jgi:hypothetical protein